MLFGLTSLAMTTAPDTKDTTVEVSLNGTSLGSFPVDNTVGTAIFDEHGTAAVDVVIPAGTPGGPATLLVEGDLTGTSSGCRSRWPVAPRRRPTRRPPPPR